jgi:hypothetical protein
LSILDKVRRWIDGETAELILEEAARDAQVKPRSEAEEFIVEVARAIEGVMQKELVPLPHGTAIIPSEYTIFLSTEDDKEWQGIKRRGLLQGLYHILAERAREIAGKNKLETKSFVIELKVDGTLSKGDLRVLHSWEESSSNKTGVLSRPKPGSQAVKSGGGPGQQGLPRSGGLREPYSPPSHQPVPNFTEQPTPRQSVPPTAPQVAESAAEHMPPQDAEVMTTVRPRVRELYDLEIWLGGVRQNVVPIYNKQITVGRGSKSKPVDISLSGDPEISRRHLLLITDGLGNFWAVNEGKNPAMIASYELPEGQKVPLRPGVSLNVGSYTLRIQQKN